MRNLHALFAVSIRKLLGILIAASAGSLLILGGAAQYSNWRAHDTQLRLIEVSRVQSNRSAILSALEAYNVRQGQVLAATSAADLKTWSDRSALESDARQAIKAMGQALDPREMGDSTVESQLKSLQKSFDDLLVAASGVYAATVEALDRQEARGRRFSGIERTLAEFQSNIHALKDEIDFRSVSAQIAIKKLMRADSDIPSAEHLARYREAASRLLDKAVRESSRLISQVEIQAANLGALAGLVTRARDSDDLQSLAENRVVPVVDRLAVLLGQLGTLIEGDTARALTQKIDSELGQLRDELLTASDSLVGLSQATLAARLQRGKAIAEQQQASQRISDVLTVIGEHTDEAQQRVFESSRSVTRLLGLGTLAVGGLTLLLVLSLGALIMTRVLRPLRHAVQALGDIGRGDGDLTKRLPRSSVAEIQALASAFNQFAGEIQQLVGTVADASGRIYDQTQRSAELSQGINLRTTEHHRDTDQVAAAVTELSASITHVAANGEEAAAAAGKAQREADVGKEIIASSRLSIEALADEIADVSRNLGELSDETKGVAKVLSVISDFAEQTNLLALNAAIEAARAGEQGRGFAVVADEVRTLASRIQESTVEINTILGRLKQGAEAVAATIGASEQKAGAAVEHAGAVTQTFEGIADSILTISQMTAEIASAVVQQSKATESISQQIIHIHGTATETADAAQDSARISSSLARLSQDLKGMIAQFKIG